MSASSRDSPGPNGEVVFLFEEIVSVLKRRTISQSPRSNSAGEPIVISSDEEMSYPPPSRHLHPPHRHTSPPHPHHPHPHHSHPHQHYQRSLSPHHTNHRSSECRHCRCIAREEEMLPRGKKRSQQPPSRPRREEGGLPSHLSKKPADFHTSRNSAGSKAPRLAPPPPSPYLPVTIHQNNGHTTSRSFPKPTPLPSKRHYKASRHPHHPPLLPPPPPPTLPPCHHHNGHISSKSPPKPLSVTLNGFPRKKLIIDHFTVPYRKRQRSPSAGVDIEFKNLAWKKSKHSSHCLPPFTIPSHHSPPHPHSSSHPPSTSSCRKKSKHSSHCRPPFTIPSHHSPLHPHSSHPPSTSSYRPVSSLRSPPPPRVTPPPSTPPLPLPNTPLRPSVIQLSSTTSPPPPPLSTLSTPPFKPTTTPLTPSLSISSPPLDISSLKIYVGKKEQHSGVQSPQSSMEHTPTLTTLQYTPTGPSCPKNAASTDLDVLLPSRADASMQHVVQDLSNIGWSSDGQQSTGTGSVVSAHGQQSSSTGSVVSAPHQQSIDKGPVVSTHGHQSTGTGSVVFAHGQQSSSTGSVVSAPHQQSIDKGPVVSTHGHQSTGTGSVVFAHGQQSSSTGLVVSAPHQQSIDKGPVVSTHGHQSTGTGSVVSAHGHQNTGSVVCGHGHQNTGTGSAVSARGHQNAGTGSVVSALQKQSIDEGPAVSVPLERVAADLYSPVSPTPLPSPLLDVERKYSSIPRWSASDLKMRSKSLSSSSFAFQLPRECSVYLQAETSAPFSQSCWNNLDTQAQFLEEGRKKRCEQYVQTLEEITKGGHYIPTLHLEPVLRQVLSVTSEALLLRLHSVLAVDATLQPSAGLPPTVLWNLLEMCCKIILRALSSTSAGSSSTGTVGSGLSAFSPSLPAQVVLTYLTSTLTKELAVSSCRTELELCLVQQTLSLTSKWQHILLVLDLLFTSIHKMSISSTSSCSSSLPLPDLRATLATLICLPVVTAPDQDEGATRLAREISCRLARLPSHHLKTCLLLLLPCHLLREKVISIHLDSEFCPSGDLLSVPVEHVSLDVIAISHLCRSPYHHDGRPHDVALFLFLIYHLLQSHCGVMLGNDFLHLNHSNHSSTPASVSVSPTELASQLRSITPQFAAFPKRLSEDPLVLTDLTSPSCWFHLQLLSRMTLGDR